MAEIINLHVKLFEHTKDIEIDEQQIQKHLTVKKIILNKFGYEPSQAKYLYLYFHGLYLNQPDHISVPAFNDLDYKFIIAYLSENQIPIQIQVKIQGIAELDRREINQKSEFQIQFDDNGSVILGQGEINENIPKEQLKYRGAELVRCAFCNKSNKDKEALKICGGLYGPFADKKFTHLNCILWCCQVYLDKQGNLMQVIKNKQQKVRKIFQIKKNLQCIYCKQKGAGLNCSNSQCYKTMHYQCAQQKDRCYMNWKNFLQLCHRCKLNQKLLEKYVLQPKGYNLDNDPVEAQIHEAQIHEKIQDINPEEHYGPKIEIQNDE